MHYAFHAGSGSLGSGVGAAAANLRAALMMAGAIGSAATAVGRSLLRYAQHLAGVQPMSSADRELVRGLPNLLVQGGYRHGTIRKYTSCVAAFLSWRHVHAVHGEDPPAVAEFLAFMQSGGAGNAVLRLHLSALRTVLDRCLGGDTTRGLNYAPRPPRTKPAPDAAVGRLLGAAGARERAIVELCTSVGLRPHELALAQWVQINEQTGTVRVARGRTPRVLKLVLPRRAREALNTYRATLPEDTCYVFPGRYRGRPISVRTVQLALQRLGKQAGVQTTLTALAAAARCRQRQLGNWTPEARPPPALIAPPWSRMPGRSTPRAPPVAVRPPFGPETSEK